MESIISTSDLKKTPSRYLKLAQHGGEPVIITEQGRASAVLLDYETYRGLIVTIEEMSSSDGRKLLQQAKKEAEDKKLISHNTIVENFLKAQ